MIVQLTFSSSSSTPLGPVSPCISLLLLPAGGGGGDGEGWGRVRGRGVVTELPRGGGGEAAVTCHYIRPESLFFYIFFSIIFTAYFT